MSFDRCYSDIESNEPQGEALINQINDSGPEDLNVSELFRKNEDAIMKLKDNICDHFTKIADKLPMEDQMRLIAGFPSDLSDQDVVYHGMKERFDAKMSATA